MTSVGLPDYEEYGATNLIASAGNNTVDDANDGVEVFVGGWQLKTITPCKQLFKVSFIVRPRQGYYEQIEHVVSDRNEDVELQRLPQQRS